MITVSAMTSHSFLSWDPLADISHSGRRIFRHSAIVVVAVVVVRFVQNLFGLIQDNAKHAIFWQGFKDAVKGTVLRAVRTHHQKSAICLIDQNRSVRKDSKRRSVDDNVI